MNRNQTYFAAKTYRLVFAALFAGIIYVGTLIRIPLGESRVSVANALCVLAGLMLKPVDAGLSAGLGSAIYDLTLGGYGPIDAVITFVSKFVMALVCALIKRLTEKQTGRTLIDQPSVNIYLISALSAFTYVVLYMAKSIFYGGIILKKGENGPLMYALLKLPASVINAVMATVLAPLAYCALWTPLHSMGIIEKFNPRTK